MMDEQQKAQQRLASLEGRMEKADETRRAHGRAIGEFYQRIIGEELLSEKIRSLEHRLVKAEQRINELQQLLKSRQEGR